MTVTRFHPHRDRYRDSLLLLAATATMSDVDGVEWASALMATPANVASLAADGVQGLELAGCSSNDLILAVRARDDAAAAQALDAGAAAAFSDRSTRGAEATTGPTVARTIAEAARDTPELNVALVSVPGEYAALEAHHALSAGMHVLLFSDNVPVEQEIELKRRGVDKGLLVMGPGAGTAVLCGTGLGFANAVRRGPVGVVAAAGTGAQEVSCLLDRWGVGVSHVIGVGGRDLSEPVGGIMARLALQTLAADPATSALILVSKPPAPAVARAVLEHARGVPTVAALIGLDPDDAALGEMSDVALLAPTLEAGAVAAARLVGVDPPPLADDLAAPVAHACTRLAARRRLVRGLFCGGTLCYETQVILTRLLGPVYSNEPLDPSRHIPAPQGSHVCLDLGAEEFTRGRPHPMIDPSTRVGMLNDLAGSADADDVAVVLLDVVLGYGSHADPAGQVAPACAALMAGGGPQVVAYVLGTAADPQDYAAQRRVLADAGCIVPGTSARAAHAAAAIALRRPELAGAGL